MPGLAAALRVGLFGGSFDPPHRGHVAIARAAADAFQLDRILFAPAGRQPLKPEGATAGFADRVAMTALACAADPRFAVSEVDAPRADGAANYTVDALQRLADELPGAALYNIVGLDSFLEVGRWKDPQRLLALAEWIVLSRPGVSGTVPHGMVLTPLQRARIHQLDWVNEDVSATAVRTNMLHHEDVTGLLPPAVAEYVLEHGLYAAAR